MTTPPYIRPQVSSDGPSHADSPSTTILPHKSHAGYSYGQPSHQDLFYPGYNLSENSSYMSHGGCSQPYFHAAIPATYQHNRPSLYAQPPMVEKIPRRSLSQTAPSEPSSSMAAPQLGSSRPPACSGGTYGSGSDQNGKPGPIPATQPIVKKVDNIDQISFEYSRNRTKDSYNIRGHVESVATKDLSPEFKELNCVYPRAYHGEAHKGNRMGYQTECNELAWALASLNPILQGRRGLIQRAVDSWRNCHKDPKLRSRRVRRAEKQSNRQANSKVASGGMRNLLSNDRDSDNKAS